MDEVPCLITSSGETFYSLEKNFDETRERRLQLQNIARKGKGIVSTTTVPIHEKLFHNESVTTIVIGKDRHKLCHHCYSCIEEKHFFRYCFPSLRSEGSTSQSLFYYCSDDCLRLNTTFHDLFHDSLIEINKYFELFTISSHDTKQMNYRQSESLFELQLLLYKFLYEFFDPIPSTEHPQQKIALLQVLDLFFPKESSSSSSADYHLFYPIAITLNNYFKQSSRRELVEKAEKKYCIQLDTDWFYHLFLRLQYNCQSVAMFPPLASSKVSLLGLFPLVARINHSCQPNSELFHQVVPLNNENHQKSPIVQISVIATSTIAAHEEITMSYLNSSSFKTTSSVSLSVLTRQHLLQEGFHFICYCSRCLSEQDAQTNSTVSDSLATLHDSMTEQLKAALLALSNNNNNDNTERQPDYNTLLQINRTIDSLESIFNEDSYPKNAARITSSAICYEYLLYSIQDMQHRLSLYIDLVTKEISASLNNRQPTSLPKSSLSLLVQHFQNYFCYIHILLRAGIFFHHYHCHLLPSLGKEESLIKKEREANEKFHYSTTFIELMIAVVLQVIKIMKFTQQQILLLTSQLKEQNNKMKPKSDPQLKMIVDSISEWSRTYLPFKRQQYLEIISSMSLSVEQMLDANEETKKEKIDEGNRKRYRHLDTFQHYSYLHTTLQRLVNLLQVFTNN